MSFLLLNRDEITNIINSNLTNYSYEKISSSRYASKFIDSWSPGKSRGS